jgi:outer membrane protein TolC
MDRVGGFTALILGLAALGAPGCADSRALLPPDVSPAAVHNRIAAPPGELPRLDAEVPADDPPAPSLPDAPDSGLFNLAQAIAYGLENNPRLRAARANIRRAQAQEIAAFAPFLPQVDSFARYGWTSSNLSPGAPGPVGGLIPSSLTQDHNFVQAELDIQYTICDFGRRAGRYGQAVANERIAELQFHRAQQTVAYDIAAAYLGLLRAQAAREVQEQTVRRAEKFLRDAQARRRGGVAETEDVLRAEVQLAESRDALLIARQAELDAMSRFNLALGRNVSLPVQVVEWRERPAFELSLRQALELAIANRREVGMAVETVSAAEFGASAARAAYYPHVYVRGSVGRADGSGIETGWHEGGAIHLDHTFYSGGKRRGDQLAAEAEVRVAAANAQALFDTISLEVNLAFRGVVTAHERIDLAERTVVQARENLRIMQVRYLNGNATPTDVVDAETSTTRAEQRYFTSIYDYLGSLARLEYAMGMDQGCLSEK